MKLLIAIRGSIISSPKSNRESRDRSAYMVAETPATPMTIVVTPEPSEYWSSWVEMSSKPGLFLNARIFESNSVESVPARWLRNISDFLLTYKLKKVFETKKTIAVAARTVTCCCGRKLSRFKKFKKESMRLPGFVDCIPLIARAPIIPTKKTPNKSKIPRLDWIATR